MPPLLVLENFLEIHLELRLQLGIRGQHGEAVPLRSLSQYLAELSIQISESAGFTETQTVGRIRHDPS